MSILEQLNAARNAALKSGDAETRTTLTTLIGEITSFAKGDGNREATDKDSIKFLTKFSNSAKENQGYASDQNNTEGFRKATAELELYAKFMPAAKPQLTEEALSRSIRSIIANRLAGDGSKPQMKTVIADLKVLHEGQYDGKTAAAFVKAELEKTSEPS